MGCKHNKSNHVTKSTRKDGYTLRRRKCHQCGEIYSTIELQLPELRHAEGARDGLKRSLLREALADMMEDLK